MLGLACAGVLGGGLLASCASARGGADVVAQALAPGVYALPAEPGLPDAANLGRVGNAGFIVGERGVLVIDAGTSYRHGQRLLAAIAQVTPLPVKLLLVTHIRQEFLFGANAFRERGIPVQMHPASARLMASRCETCLKALKALVGDDEMRGSAVPPDEGGFDAGRAAALIGRPLQVLYFGHSSGPGDLAVFDERSGVLFAGGLVDSGQVPDIGDGRLPAWRDALAQLARLPLARVVPGHGPVQPPPALAAQRRYLDQLESSVAALLKAGTSLAEVVDQVDLPEFRGWVGYDLVHRRNVSLMYLRLEQAELLN